MMLCRTVDINFIYLEIFTQAIKQISTGHDSAPTIRRRQRTDAKFSAAAPAKTRRRRRRRRGWRGVELYYSVHFRLAYSVHCDDVRIGIVVFEALCVRFSTHLGNSVC
jgi:hypothetical protein